jgi:hypothetical protein
VYGGVCVLVMCGGVGSGGGGAGRGSSYATGCIFFNSTLTYIMYMLLTNAYMYTSLPARGARPPPPPHNKFNPNICKAEISNLKKSEGIAMLCLRSLLHSSSTSREVSPDVCVRAKVI